MSEQPDPWKLVEELVEQLEWVCEREGFMYGGEELYERAVDALAAHGVDVSGRRYAERNQPPKAPALTADDAAEAVKAALSDGGEFKCAAPDVTWETVRHGHIPLLMPGNRGLVTLFRTSLGLVGCDFFKAPDGRVWSGKEGAAGPLSRLSKSEYDLLDAALKNARWGEVSNERRVAGPHHADGCDGTSFRYVGDGYNRSRKCRCGAEDHDPAPGWASEVKAILTGKRTTGEREA